MNASESMLIMLLSSVTYLAGTVLDDNKRALPDGTGLLGVGQRGTGVRRLEVDIVLYLSLQNDTALNLRPKPSTDASEHEVGGGGSPSSANCCYAVPVVKYRWEGRGTQRSGRLTESIKGVCCLLLQNPTG